MANSGAGVSIPQRLSDLVGGLDDPQKVMSSEYDLIYCHEATELAENEWETLATVSDDERRLLKAGSRERNDSQSVESPFRMDRR